MQFKLIASTALLALALGGCQTQQTQEAAAPAQAKAATPVSTDAAQAITAAKTALKKAASVEGAWRDTGKLIKKAEAAVEKGDEASAIKLADKARRQAELGYTQAMNQQQLKMPSYLGQ